MSAMGRMDQSPTALERLLRALVAKTDLRQILSVDKGGDLSQHCSLASAVLSPVVCSPVQRHGAIRETAAMSTCVGSGP